MKEGGARLKLTWLGHSAFLVETGAGHRLILDPNLFGDMALIGELYESEAAMLPIGGHFTMGPREAARACRLLGVDRVIPMHYGTFPVLSGTPEALRAELESESPRCRVVALEPGQSA